MANQMTVNNLPENLKALRTGTANDGRALIHLGAAHNHDSALRDIRSRLPKGWTAELYAQTGIDAVLTHVG